VGRWPGHHPWTGDPDCTEADPCRDRLDGRIGMFRGWKSSCGWHDTGVHVAFQRSVSISSAASGRGGCKCRALLPPSFATIGALLFLVAPRLSPSRRPILAAVQAPSSHRVRWLVVTVMTSTFVVRHNWSCEMCVLVPRLVRWCCETAASPG
jgi:hypothetical protein